MLELNLYLRIYYVSYVIVWLKRNLCIVLICLFVFCLFQDTMGSLKVLHHSVHPHHSHTMKTSKPLTNSVTQFLRLVSSDPTFPPPRSPLASPPTDKKRLRGGSVTQQQHSPTIPSILRRPHRQQQSHPHHQRGVVFNSHVKVQYIGDSERKTYEEPLHTEQHQPSRQIFLTRNAAKQQRQMQVLPIDSAAGYCGSSPSSIASAFSSYAAATTTTTNSSDPSYSNTHTTHIPSNFHDNNSTTPSNFSTTVTANSATNNNNNHVNISFVQNKNNVTEMKFVVYLGPSYDPESIVVKANMSGSRLRVVAEEQSYSERFQLPMQVDPYKVEARLDARGYLTVTAPLIEQSSTSISV